MNLTHALGWTLLHFLWQGALIAVLLAGALALLRSASSRSRYAVSCAAMMLMLACAAVTSSGAIVSRPEYSWAAIDFSALNDASNVAVTFNPEPPMTFFAYQISNRQPARAPLPVVGPTAFPYALPLLSVTVETLRALLL